MDPHVDSLKRTRASWHGLVGKHAKEKPKAATGKRCHVQKEPCRKHVQREPTPVRFEA